MKDLLAEIAEGAVSPEPPWPVGRDNAKREGWTSFFQGRPREWSPFPAGRPDLKRGYQEGWDAAASTGGSR